MEGLIGVVYNGAFEIELTFRDPPEAVIAVLEYAMLNHLPLDIGIIKGSKPGGMMILKMDTRNEIERYDATTYGPLSPIYLTKIVHRLKVHARSA